MAMRETVRSLRAYFIVLGVLSGAQTIFALATQPVNLETVFLLASFVLAAAFLYVGIRLKTLLASSPRLVIGVVLATGVLSALLLLLMIVFGGPIGGMVQAVIGLLIAWYPYNNVRRLSAESRAITATP